MDEATEARLAAAQSTQPDRELTVAEGPLGSLILGTPTRDAYLQYRILLRSDSPMDNARASDELLISCAVDPGPIEVKAMLKKKPGMATHPDVLRAIGELVGTVTKK
jgi:hypothetical protein